MTTQSPFAIDKEALQHTLKNSFKGIWTGEGLDVLPTSTDPEKTIYAETLTFGDVFTTRNLAASSAEQTIIGIHFNTQLVDKLTKTPMLQQSGCWLFDIANGQFYKAISNPQDMSIVAGGVYFITFLHGQPTDILISATSENSNKINGILPNSSLKQKAFSNKFVTQIKHSGNTISYYENSVLNIHGEEVNHTDTATLVMQS